VAPPPPPPPPADDIRPELFSNVAGFADVNTDPGAIASNALLSLIALLVILYGSSIFNSTIKENSDELNLMLGRLLAPFGAVYGFANSLFGHSRWQESFLYGVLKPFAFLALMGLIYSLLEPGFGLTRESLVLVASLAAAMFIITYVFEGGQVLAHERWNGLPADLRFYPVPIMIAIASVVLSRIAGINPGFIVGFVASATFLSHNDRLAGRAVMFSMAALLSVSILAWVLISPFRSLSEGNEAWWAAALEASTIAVFVAGIEGILFALMPLEFVEGKKLWTYSRVAWFAAALPATFLFFHVVIGFEDSVGSEDSMTLLMVGGALVAVSSLIWLFFKLRMASQDTEAA
jgi:hypothetical protein